MRHPHYDLHNSVTPCTPFHLCRPSCKKSYNIDLSRPPRPKLTFKFASSSSSRARLCSVRQLAIDDPVASSRPPALFGISATCCFSGPLGLLGRKMHTGCGWHALIAFRLAASHNLRDVFAQTRCCRTKTRLFDPAPLCQFPDIVLHLGGLVLTRFLRLLICI